MGTCSFCTSGSVCTGKREIEGRIIIESRSDQAEASRNIRLQLQLMSRMADPLPEDAQLNEMIRDSTDYLEARKQELDRLTQLSIKSDPSLSYRSGLLQPLKCRPAVERFTGTDLAEQQKDCTHNSITVFQALDVIKRGGY